MFSGFDYVLCSIAALFNCLSVYMLVESFEIFTTSEVTQCSPLATVCFCNYSATGFVFQDYNAAIERLKVSILISTLATEVRHC